MRITILEDCMRQDYNAKYGRGRLVSLTPSFNTSNVITIQLLYNYMGHPCPELPDMR
jgi:hypothetical protein